MDWLLLVIKSYNYIERESQVFIWENESCAFFGFEKSQIDSTSEEESI